MVHAALDGSASRVARALPREAGGSASWAVSRARAWARHEEATRHRRVRSLVGLLGLYAAALMIVTMVSDGPDIGCVLGGIGGHVLYATRRVVSSWRTASRLERAKARVGWARLEPKYA